MSTAATTSYNLNAQDIIDLALTDIGVVGQSGASPDADVRPHALKMLNLLLKSLDTEGIFTWKVVRRTQTLTGGTAAYVLPNDVSDVDEPARYTAAGATYGSQVFSIVRDEYMALPDRTIPGVPYQYFIEKALDTGGIEQITMTLYPVPPNTGDTLEYAAVPRMRDVTALQQTLDIPQKGLNVVRLGLSAFLAPSYNTPPTQLAIFQKLFSDAKEAFVGDDNERGPMQMVPFGSNYYGYSGGGRY